MTPPAPDPVSRALSPQHPLEEGDGELGIGASLVLVALGAILAWAVQADLAGVNVTAAGVILMVVGVIGLALSLVFWSSWGGPRAIRTRRTTYVRERPVDRYVERY